LGHRTRPVAGGGTLAANGFEGQQAAADLARAAPRSAKMGRCPPRMETGGAGRRGGDHRPGSHRAAGEFVTLTIAMSRLEVADPSTSPADERGLVVTKKEIVKQISERA